MASTRTIRKRALKKVRDGNALRWFMKAARAQLKAKQRTRGVTIPPGSVLSMQEGDCWRVLNGPESGMLKPMTAQELRSVGSLAVLHTGEAIIPKAWE